MWKETHWKDGPDSLTDMSPERRTTRSIWKMFLTVESGKYKLNQTPLHTYNGQNPGWHQQMLVRMWTRKDTPPPAPHCCWEHRIVSCFGRVWQFLIQLNILLSTNLTIDFWSFPKGVENSHLQNYATVQISFTHSYQSLKGIDSLFSRQVGQLW